jgi:hypothetical protein
MTFIFGNKRYIGTTALQIVKTIMKDSGYKAQTQDVKEFLHWSLAQFADRIHRRELDLGAHLPDETLAFSYLCLLDKYSLGCLYQTQSKSISR